LHKQEFRQKKRKTGKSKEEGILISPKEEGILISKEEG
jgi:hypothetical protein